MTASQKTVFDDFGKEVLIKFLLRSGAAFRYVDDEKLRSELGFINWEIMSLKAKNSMEKAILDAGKEDRKTQASYARWMKAHKDFDKAQKLYDKADKIYKAAAALRDSSGAKNG